MFIPHQPEPMSAVVITLPAGWPKMGVPNANPAAAEF
jgi:hypothetical protein